MSRTFSEGADAHWSPCPMTCGFFSGKSTGMLLLGVILGTVFVSKHTSSSLCPTLPVWPHTVPPSVLTCFPLNPPPSIPPASLCPRTHPDNACRERLGLLKPEIGQILREPLVLGHCWERQARLLPGRGVQESLLALSLVPRK